MTRTISKGSWIGLAGVFLIAFAGFLQAAAPPAPTAVFSFSGTKWTLLDNETGQVSRMFSGRTENGLNLSTNSTFADTG